jgi:hypothetical protein
MMHDWHKVRIVPDDTCHGEDPNDTIRLGDDEMANPNVPSLSQWRLTCVPFDLS